MFFGENTASHLTDDGWRMFDEAVAWAGVGDAPPVNEAPVVHAGSNQTVAISVPATVTLVGSVTDDGLPEDGVLTYEWSTSHEETTIVSPQSLSTQVTFSDYGSYSLSLTASDGALSASDQVVITVENPLLPPTNLVYTHNPATYTQGVVIPQNTPSCEGGLAESFSITPPLPEGLSLEAGTGVISGTPAVSSDTAVYSVTASNDAGSTTAFLTITVVAQSGTQTLLFVVGSQEPGPGDQALLDRLESTGYAVQLQDDDLVSLSDADGMDLVLISSSVNSGKVAATFRDAEAGVIVFEGYVFDDMALTGSAAGRDYGYKTGQSQVVVLDGSHPIAGGMSGTVTFADNAEGNIFWGVPNSNAARIAGLVSDQAKVTVFAYEQGAVLYNGAAAADRRVGMFFGENTASHLTDDGWRMFDAAVAWAMGNSL
jgi:hypothetical protein